METYNFYHNFRKIYLGADINWDTPIMRYMSLHSLEQILNLKFFVNERNRYDNIDPHERGQYEKAGYAFRFTLCKKTNATQKKENDQINEKLSAEIEKSYITLTSCWTLSQTENKLMWKDKEVLIKTTIGKFLMSLDIQYSASIICGKVHYSANEQMKFSLEQFLFLKEGENFKHEEELRFYIDSNLRNGINTKGVPDEKSALVPLNNYSFIDAIVFNPHLSAHKEKESLIDKYPFIIKLIQTSELL